MKFETQLIVISVNHFQSKDKTKNYYMLDCITPENESTEYIHGYKTVKVFIDEVQYNSILGTFEPLKKFPFFASVSGDRVKYSLKM